MEVHDGPGCHSGEMDVAPGPDLRLGVQDPAAHGPPQADTLEQRRRDIGRRQSAPRRPHLSGVADDRQRVQGPDVGQQQRPDDAGVGDRFEDVGVRGRQRYRQRGVER